MSKIDKLSILGVRSFDNARSETIQFHTPLTLIVGYNGSGKTTIIECLKYATTGELPPNSKGGAFIHDPKLCGEKEVLAQVKLSFKSTSGHKMVATRSLQLTVKKLTRSQKTLEGQLLMIKDGERTAVSSRVAELDQIMPQYLGVSKAILESVIFCHQDDSLWPMSEPSVLKKRFDEIFEALKYTKAIDNIKILRKKQNEELAKFKIIEQHAKEDKEKGDKAEKRSTELFDEIEALRGKSEELGNKIKEATENSRVAWEHAARFESICAKLEGKRIEAQALGRNVQELKSNIKEMTDSDEELQSILDRYEERMTLYERENEAHRLKYGELQHELEKSRRSLGIKQSEIGKFEAQKDHYERQLQNRETLVKETARRHNIRGFDFDITDGHVRDFMERVGKMARDQNAALERAKRETHGALQGAQQELNQLNERRSALNESKNHIKAQINGSERRITAFQTEHDRIEIDEGGKAVLESTLQNVEERLVKTKKEYEIAEWDAKIRRIDTEMRQLDETKDKLDAELIQATRQAGDSARLDFLRKEHRDRECSLDTMTAAHGQRISQIIGSSWTPSNLEEQFHMALEQRTSDLRDAELQRDGTNRELEQVQFKLKTVRDDLNQKRKDVKMHESTIRRTIDREPSMFPEYLRELEESRDVQMGDRTSFKHLTEYYSECIQIVQKHDVCRLCMRRWDNRNGRDQFIKRLEDLLQKARKDASEDDLTGIEEELREVKAQTSTYDTLVRLQTSEIPILESDQRTLEGRHESLIEKLQNEDEEASQRRMAKREVESVAKTVQNIVKSHSETLNFDAQIAELSAKQATAGLSRGLEKIQEELKQINEQARSLRSTLAQHAREKDHAKSSINGLELEARDTKAKLSTAIFQLKEKTGLVGQIGELKAVITEQQDTIKQIDIDVGDLTPKISQAQARYDDITRRGAEREKELHREASKLSDSIHQLKLADQEINCYIDRGGPQQLARTRREIENLEHEVTRVEGEQRQVTVEIKKIEDNLRNHADTRRSITDNLRYRAGVRDLQAVRAEIEQLEAHNAQVDKERFEREASKWQMERNRLTAEQASMIGELKSKDNQLQQLLQDWETDYKDAAYKYKESHIKVETTKAAVEDLGRYGSALDKAIMKYHSIKMEEINRIIEELWKKTYQGTDVDSIMIRSDNENVKGNKSYNYRVVMVKQDAEMDMRGRCSAGQKVLASIIIRLALAECFGVNCGLIALDEPTTNLDRDNIRALAEALAEIIRVRREQSNFQLIVITHDEDFLRYMQCADFCDNYYRVSRNEKQKSIIERQSIAEVV